VQVNCTVHVNSAIHSWTMQENYTVRYFSSEQCKSLALNSVCYTVYAN
jgi:hypothetical protein